MVLDDVVMLTLQVGHLIANCKTLKVNGGWNISLAFLLYLSGSGAVFDAAVGIYCVSTLCADTGCTTHLHVPPKKMAFIQTTAYSNYCLSTGKSASELDSYLLGHIIPAVVGPANGLYVLLHQSRTYLLL